jgi:hypothetical protein
MISQQDRAEESYAREVSVKADPDCKEEDCVYELVHPVKVDKTFCVSDSDTVEDTHLNNDSDNCKKLVDRRFTTAIKVSTRSSPRLKARKAQKELQPRKGVVRLRASSMLNKQIPSKLNFRPLRPKNSSVVGQEAAGDIHPTRTPTAAKGPQPKGSKSKSTITVLQPYEPSNSMTSAESVRYIRDILSSHKSEKETSTSVPTVPPGKVPISRCKSSVSLKGQIQALTTPSQLQANLLSAGNMEQLQAFLSSLVGSGQLQTLVPSTSSLLANKQISSKTATLGKEEALMDTVTKSKHDILATSSKNSLKPKQGTQSSVLRTNRVFTHAGKVTITEKELQFFSPGQIKMTVPTLNNPKPDAINPCGQLQVDSSSSVAGDLGRLQIPVPTSSVGQIHTVQIPYAGGTSHSNFQAMLPPFQAVLPSAAGGSQVFQFQPVIAPVSSGQVNTLVPASGTQIQLQAVIPSAGMFNVINRPTSN